MKRKLALSGLALWLGLLCAAQAQAPLLQVSRPTPMSMQLPTGKTAHAWRVLLTNPYRAPATAYAISFVTPLRLHRKARGGRWFDSIPGAHLVPPLAPRATTAFLIPWHRGKAPLVRDLCVIYADGATAGEPVLIDHFLRVRAVFLAELPPTIARLQAIAHGSVASRKEVLNHFQRQAKTERRLLHQYDVKGKHPRVPPRIAGSIVATLSSSQRDVQDIAAALASTFTLWQTQLAASRPHPAPVLFPTVR